MSLEMVGGFRVSSYTSGTEAIEFAPATKPDMILLDVMMPGMDGLTTYAQLKKIPELQNTPILFVMARVQPKEVRQLHGTWRDRRDRQTIRSDENAQRCQDFLE